LTDKTIDILSILIYLPEKRVNLLIYDVEGEDAHDVIVDETSGRSKLPEITFGYFGKYEVHGVHAVRCKR
jgi:hypothetical protein